TSRASQSAPKLRAKRRTGSSLLNVTLLNVTLLNVTLLNVMRRNVMWLKTRTSV
ncbi:MAG: hypothetical protein ACI9KE_001461, partial [Polyangiales bacterium]